MAKQVPRYLIIREKILESVKEDDFLHNGRLPSEDELAKYFGVSRSTVRSALQSLESDGIVEKNMATGITFTCRLRTRCFSISAAPS